jgi:dTDP-4-dehydrorhamnose reductase
VKILLVGAVGQLGSDLVTAFRKRGDAVVAPPHSQLDVRDSAKLRQVIAETRSELVVSTAAFHKVEECEQQPLLAFDVNAVGSANLAQACEDVSCPLVFFSTDYVFGGDARAPYVETDLAEPVNVYGASKVAGEHLVRIGCKRYWIIRTSGLYGLAGSSGKGGNFVENMLKRAAARVDIRVVDDQVLTPTYTADVAEALLKLTSAGHFGTYHITNEGECSWYRFTRELFRIQGVSPNLSPVTTDEFPSPVKRPRYSVLSKQKLALAGIKMPHWEDALGRYLAARFVVQGKSLA